MAGSKTVKERPKNNFSSEYSSSNTSIYYELAPRSTHFRPMFPFHTPWKPKVFWRFQGVTLTWNGLKGWYYSSFKHCLHRNRRIERWWWRRLPKGINFKNGILKLTSEPRTRCVYFNYNYTMQMLYSSIYT